MTVARLSPSGPPLDIDDWTPIAEGTILLRPFGLGTGPPIEGSGVQAGSIVRFSDAGGGAFNGGTYNNFALARGVKLVDIDPNAGQVIITGFAQEGGNVGGFFSLGKLGNSDSILLRAGDVGSLLDNRITTPGNLDYILQVNGDSVFVFYLNNRWQLAQRLTPAFGLGSELNGLGPVFTIRNQFVAGTGGAPDDVAIIAASAVPFGFRIEDVTLQVSTAVGGSTCQLRTASGGGGAALSSALSSAATGTVRNNDTTTRTVAANGTVFLRRSDGAVAGTVIAWCVKT